MDGLTIHEAAETTGWSPRMLRYVERVGLIEPARNEAGYRIYGPAELRRLRTLHELIARFGCGLSDVAFAKRMEDDEGLREALAAWLSARPERTAEAASAGPPAPKAETPEPALALADGA